MKVKMVIVLTKTNEIRTVHESIEFNTEQEMLNYMRGYIDAYKVFKKSATIWVYDVKTTNFISFMK